MSDAYATDLETLARLFKDGGWRELRVTSRELSVLYSTDPDAELLDPDTANLLVPSAVRPASSQAVAPAKPVSAPAPVVADPNWTAILAPNLGTFYRSPKPGSAPFVEIGDTVTPDTEICLLEVMKLFTSVKAGVGGIVRVIAASDAELVEGGQTLFHIEPQGT